MRAIAPGCVLMAAEGPRAVGKTSDGLDPLVGAFLAFMGADLNANPHRVRPLDLSPVVALVEGVTPARDDEYLPDVSRCDHGEGGTSAKPWDAAGDPGRRPGIGSRHGFAPSRLRRMRPIISAPYAENIVALRA